MQHVPKKNTLKRSEAPGIDHNEPLLQPHSHHRAAHDAPMRLQDEKADVILKYMADEARNLKAYGELPESIRVNDADVFDEYEGDDNDDIVEFDDIDDI
jgi:hypothetical protein